MDDNRNEHWEEGCWGQGEWNDHEHNGKEEVPGSGKNSLMFGENGLEFLQQRGCLNGMNGMELCNNARMTFFEDFFYAMGIDDDLRGTDGDVLELVVLTNLETHIFTTPPTFHGPAISNHDLKIIDGTYIAISFLGNGGTNKIMGASTVNKDDDLPMLNVTN
jgi:hypothetical protein